MFGPLLFKFTIVFIILLLSMQFTEVHRFDFIKKLISFETHILVKPG